MNERKRYMILKTRILLAAILLLITGITTSCIMENDFAACPPQKGLKVTSIIDFGGGTTLWPKGSAIGITVLKAGTSESVGNNSDKHYVVSDQQTGESVPNESADPIYLPEDGSEADVIAYYPYTIPFDDTYKAPLSVSDQSKPDSLDLITSDRVCNIPADTEQIDLKFYRRLTKQIFTIKLIEVDTNGKETIVNERLPGISLAVTGMPVTGSYSLPDNKLTVDDKIENITTLINKEGTKSSAIVFPREAGEGVTFVVTFPNGKKHTFRMDPEQTLKAGTENKYDIVIKLKKDTPPVDPEYKITYELQGGLTPDNITVTQGSNNTAWSLSQTITVKKGTDFSFLYNSTLGVIARLSDGTVLDTKNNTSYPFGGINKDMHIILSTTGEPIPPVDPPVPPIDPPVPGTYNVTYELQGDLTARNISLEQSGNTWAVGDVITVKADGSFSFLYNSALEVNVRLSDGTSLNISNNTSYSFADIKKDIHIILSSTEIPTPPTPPTPTYYEVTYDVQDVLKPDDITVNKADGTAWTGKVTVSAGSNFTFTYELKTAEKVDIVVNLKDGTKLTSAENKTYTVENIRKDIHIIIAGEPKAPSDVDQDKKDFISAEVIPWKDLDTVEDVIVPDKEI